MERGAIMNNLCEICKGEQHTSTDHPYLPMMETHNPLDIAFGHEVHEVNNNVKDKPTEEGGMGSGRQPDFGDDAKSGSAPGELVTFETVPILNLEETVNKQVIDAKLKCPCKAKTST